MATAALRDGIAEPEPQPPYVLTGRLHDECGIEVPPDALLLTCDCRLYDSLWKIKSGRQTTGKLRRNGRENLPLWARATAPTCRAPSCASG